MKYAALTVDQRSSRSGVSRVDEWVDELNAEFGSTLELPFAVTLGDEFQGLTREPRTVVEVVARAVRCGLWWVGVGFGEVEEPLADTAPRSRGPAFYRARDSAQAAKTQPWGFALSGDSNTRRPEAVLRLLALLWSRRGDKQWEAVDLARRGLTQEEIADRFAISKQAVSQRLRHAAWEDEEEGRWLAESLVADVLRDSPDG